MSTDDEWDKAPRISRRVKRLIRGIRMKRGFENEQRFFDAFKHAEEYEMPHWWVSFRKATPFEDHQLKIDAVLVTDVGKIYFQVKSSKAMAHAFGLQKRKRHIIPLVVSGPTHTPGEIRMMVLREASRYRDQLIIERQRYMAAE